MTTPILNVPTLEPVIYGLVQMLSTVTERPWGDHDAPSLMPTDEWPTYGLVELTPGGEASGDVGSPHGMRDVVVTFRAVSEGSHGPVFATRLQDRARTALLGMDSGGFAYDIECMPNVVIWRDWLASGGVDWEGDMCNCVEQYMLRIAVHSNG